MRLAGCRGARARLAALLLVGVPTILGASPLLGAPPRRRPPPLPSPSASAATSAASASAPAASAPAASAAPAPSASAAAEPLPAPEEEGSAEGSERGEGVAAVLWPTATPAGDGAAGGTLRAPGSKDGGLVERARELDAVLAEAAQDLGLLLDVGARGPALPRAVRDGDLAEEALTRKAWVISPRIERDGGELLVRIVAVPPESKVVLVREERVAAGRLSRRAVVMLRDLVQARGGTAKAPVAAPSRDEAPEPPRGRTSGRGVLMVSMAVFGGYVGYALHTSSRGNDPRLLYPLMALGTGVGLGAATLVADEWAIGLGDAWFLASGAVWPTTSALLLSEGYQVKPSTDGHAFGLVAGIGGMGLASVALARRSVSEGGAVLAHSGGVVGGFLGGLTEMTVRGSRQVTPFKGLGYGAAGGWLGAAAVASFVDFSASRVMAADLGAGLGALGAAAVASPLLLDSPTPNQERAWLVATMAGAVAGAATGAWLGRPAARTNSKVQAALRLLPAPGVVATVPRGGGEWRPVAGLTWSGSW